MLGSTLAKVAMPPESSVALTLKFLGEPLVALGIAVMAAVICLGWANGMPREQVGGTADQLLAWCACGHVQPLPSCS